MVVVKQELNIYITLSGKEAEEVALKINTLKLTYREIFLKGLEAFWKD